MTNREPKNIVVKFDLASLEVEAAKNNQGYWEYVWRKLLKGLDLSRLEMVELLSGDSEGTIMHDTELVYCVGFTYRNKNQFEYLKNHVTEAIKQTKSVMCIEIDSKDPLPPDAVVSGGMLIDEGCDSGSNPEQGIGELQEIYKELNPINVAYVADLYIGVPSPKKEVTLQEVQQILGNSIYHGMYTKKKMPIIKINFIMAALFFGALTVFSLIQLINGDRAGFVMLFAMANIIWTVVAKHGIIMSLLKDYECVLVTIPKIEGVTVTHPEKHGKLNKLYKLLRRGSKEFPIFILGTFLPKKIIALPMK